MRKVKRNSPITHCIVKSEEMTVDPSIIPQGLSIPDKKNQSSKISCYCPFKGELFE